MTEAAGVTIDWAGQIADEMRHTRETLARVEAVVAAQTVQLTQLTDAINRQNGRVTKLESSEVERQLREQFAAGEAKQRSQMVLSRGQWAAIGSLLAMAGAVAGIVDRLL